MGSLYFTPPWKVTDPHDPKFAAENFRYEDYYDPKKLQEALRVMFPPGTSKEYVEKILFEKQSPLVPGKSEWGVYKSHLKDDPRGTNAIGYYYDQVPNPISKFVLKIVYDKDDRVIEILDHGVPLFNANKKEKQ